MSQNQEIIESKLCAYIDGELDPEGRAEIEKHLEANPQHRRLLESLRATRDLLRWLPREPAPAELAETLNGQLERSVLLDYGGESLRVGRWPRLLGAAAIVALTAGLGVAVYYALPGSQKSTLAFHGSESSKGTLAEPAPAPGVPEAAHGTLDSHRDIMALDQAEAPEHEALNDKLSAVPAEKPPEPAKKDEIAGEKSQNDLDQLAQQVAQNRGAFVAAASGAKGATTEPASPPVANAVVMLVRSDSPAATERKLTSYLDSQQIQWRQPQVSSQVEQNTQQLPSSSGSNNQSQTLQEPPGAKQADVKAQSQQRVGSRDAGKQKLDAKGGTASNITLFGTSRGAETQPAQVDALRQPSLQSPQIAAPAQNFRQIQASLNGGSGNGVLVCQMSRRQAVQLTNTISRDGVQAAEIRELNNLAGPQAMAQYGKQAVAGTANSLEQRDALKAAPAPAANGQISNQPASAVAPSPRTPTTQPAESETIANPVASTAPPAALEKHLTTGSSSSWRAQPATAPASQPAVVESTPTTAPVDEPVNVVILVEPKETAQAPATQPAAPQTQPAQ